MQDSSTHIIAKHPDTIGGKIYPPFSYIDAKFDSVPDFLEGRNSIDSLIPKVVSKNVKLILDEQQEIANRPLNWVTSILNVEKNEEEIFFYQLPKTDSTILSVGFVVGIFLWAFFRFLDRDGWLEFLGSIGGGSTLKESLRNEKVYTSPFPIKFAFLGHILFGIFSASALISSGYFEGWNYFILFFTGGFLFSLVFFVLKIVLVSLGGTVFEIRQNAAVHSYFLYISQLLMSIVLFLFVGVMLVDIKISSLVIHIFTAVIISISSFYTIAQCLVNFSYKNRSHYFYILLYLCTLEVLPLVTLGGYLITKT